MCLHSPVTKSLRSVVLLISDAAGKGGGESRADLKTELRKEEKANEEVGELGQTVHTYTHAANLRSELEWWEAALIVLGSIPFSGRTLQVGGAGSGTVHGITNL